MDEESVQKIKQQAKRVETLPPAAQGIIDGYSGLRLGSKKVSTPYYINRADSIPGQTGKYYKIRKSFQRGLIGKGKPEEIEKIVEDHAKKHHFNLEMASVSQIQKFMFDHGIGIDCSGIVTWTLNEVTKAKLHKPIWKCITIPASSPFRFLINLIRPVENTSAFVLKQNATIINDLKEVQPGDILLTRPQPTYTHVIIITEIGFKSKDQLLYIDYSQSTDWYSNKNGIINGTIIVTQPKDYLAEQHWYEKHVKNYTYQGVLNDPTQAHIMRLTCLQ